MNWRDLTTEGRIDAIKAVWEDGMSSTQIMEALPYHDVSRNAVIGVMHRHKAKLMGVYLRPFGDNGQVRGKPRKPRKSRAKPASELRRVPRPQPQPKRRVKVVSPSILFEPVPPKKLPEPVFIAGERLTVGRPLYLLGLNECRWAVNDADKGELHLFCGSPAEGPWCECHRRKSIGIGTRSEQIASRVLLAA